MHSQFWIDKVKEDGTKLEIRVILIDGKFKIDNIGVKQKGKRKYTYVCGSRMTDDYSYRVLDTKSLKWIEYWRHVQLNY